ncbi:MAG: DIP1984 family protein, partial [Eubacteriales bacterium]|nr:DIP1984 family protein [Eubacteriales bacterium]
MDINTVNEGMSLAEALQLRADIKTRIAQLHSRLNDNAKVQEGEAPAEDPLRLIELLSAECEAYETLIRRINLTNAATVLDGQTLTALLARRDALSLELSIMRDFLQQASQRIDRYS